MSDFVRLTLSDIQAMDDQDIRDIVVNRRYISHLVRRYDYTVIHFANGDRTVNVRESPTDILSIAPLRSASDTS